MLPDDLSELTGPELVALIEAETASLRGFGYSGSELAREHADAILAQCIAPQPRNGWPALPFLCRGYADYGDLANAA